MRMFLLTTLLCGALLTTTACGGDDDNDPTTNPATQTESITCSPESVSIPATGGSVSVSITTVKNEWGAGVSADWITLSRTGGSAGSSSLTVTAAANPTTKAREGTITIMAGTARKIIAVTQEAGSSNVYNAPDGYSLVWHDEFDEGSELNAADWTHEVQSAGWVNNELQNYVNHTTPGGAKVTSISGGSLRITCLKEDGKVYSGRVYAHVGTGWQFGYIEARIKLPSGKGTWPAFWMMPVTVDWATEGWPKCGEIDIMEEVGCVPNEVSSSLHSEGHNHTNGTQITHAMTIDKAEGEFHTYAIEWTAKNITTYVDGKVQLSYDNDGSGTKNWPYSKPFYVILNLAWGGSWGGMYGVNESALPVTMEVDYLRVFQK